MKHKLALLGLTTMLMAVSPLTTHVSWAQARRVALSPADEGWISRVQAALAATHIVKARFQQIAPDGRRTTGTAYLSRPGRMRFEYDKPSPLLLIANDGKIVYQDRDIGQVTSLPLERTPLGLLLRADLRLSGDVTVTGFEHRDGQVFVTLVRTATPSEGSLTLIFNEQPLVLRAWVVRDAQGQDTQVDLFNQETPATVPDSLFVLPRDDD